MQTTMQANPYRLFISIVAVPVLTLVTNLAWADVRALSREEFKQYSGEEAYWEINVACTGYDERRVMQQPVNGNTWCAKDAKTLCHSNKMTAAQKVCGQTYKREAAAQLAKANAAKKAAAKPARKPVVSVEANKPASKPATARVSTQSSARQAATQKPATKSVTLTSLISKPESGSIKAAPRNAAPDPAAVLAENSMLQDQIEIEEQRILIEQQKLDLRRRELDLKKRELLLRQQQNS